MGNQGWCTREVHHDDFPAEIAVLAIQPVEKGHQVQTLPTLSKAAQQFLNTEKPFEYQLSKIDPTAFKIVKIGNDFYHGPLDFNLKPQGYAHYYKRDDSLFICRFQAGQMVDNVYYVLPNGSHFYGFIKNDFVERGKFVEGQFQYEGEFKHNLFDGQGKQKTKDYLFQGTYNQGKRVKGRLVWNYQNFQFIYQGQFNRDGQFHGQGILTQLQGVYKGNFKNGLKHGRGVYKFTVSGLIYSGEYFEGRKQGKGKLLNADKSTCYEGQFANGLPDGTGSTYRDNQQVKTEFKEGIPKASFQQLQIFQSRHLLNKNN